MLSILREGSVEHRAAKQAIGVLEQLGLLESWEAEEKANFIGFCSGNPEASAMKERAQHMIGVLDFIRKLRIEQLETED